MSNSLKNLPKEKLRWLIEREGSHIVQNLKKSESLLKDVCGDYKKELFLIVSALKEGIPMKLLSCHHNELPIKAQINQLTWQLVNNLGFSKDNAKWAVETWMYALSIKSYEDKTTVDKNTKQQKKKSHGMISSSLVVEVIIVIILLFTSSEIVKGKLVTYESKTDQPIIEIEAIHYETYEQIESNNFIAEEDKQVPFKQLDKVFKPSTILSEQDKLVTNEKSIIDNELSNSIIIEDKHESNDQLDNVIDYKPIYLHKRSLNMTGGIDISPLSDITITSHQFRNKEGIYLTESSLLDGTFFVTSSPYPDTSFFIAMKRDKYNRITSASYTVFERENNRYGLYVTNNLDIRIGDSIVTEVLDIYGRENVYIKKYPVQPTGYQVVMLEYRVNIIDSNITFKISFRTVVESNQSLENAIVDGYSFEIL